MAKLENEIKIVLFGLGPMGRRIANGILEKKGFRIVGAVDVAEDLVGKDLDGILKLGKTTGVEVTSDAESLFSTIKADIAIISTRSKLADVYPQIDLCVQAGVNVISTCEELSYPYYRYPQLSCQIDEMAKKFQVTVLGTGINPGYLMDVLPITLTGACQRVDRIKVVRMMDSSKRRIPYQKKIGTGVSPEEFRELIDKKKITGHVGLVESIAMIAAALGWKLAEIREEPPEAVIAEKEISTPYTTVGPGFVAGLRSLAYGIKDGEPVIVLEFISHAAVGEEYDAISIEGLPRIDERISGGVNGDVGTVAVIVNMIPKVINSKAGLVTMKDLPLPSAITEDVRIYRTS